jgi:rsbT co-antagonist protein RsbR
MQDLEKRLAVLEDMVGKLSVGQFGAENELSPGDDALGRVERAFNYLLMDLQTLTLATQEREAFLLEQQNALQEKSRTIELQAKTLADQDRELQLKLRVIQQQANAIAQLSTPIMEIWRDVLLLPIVGTVDTHRSVSVKRTLLAAIGRSRARCVILDVTGVELVDSSTANHLLKVVRAATLMGAHCVLTGLNESVSETLVDLGIDLSEVATLGSLRDGLRHCLQHIRSSSSAG